MGNASLEHSVGIIATGDTLKSLRESGLCFQCIYIDGVEPVPAVRETLDLVGLIIVRLRRQVPSISTGINDSGSLGRGVVRVIHESKLWLMSVTYGDTDGGIDIDAAVEICGEKRDVQIPLGNYGARFSINFVDIILCCSNKDVLYAVIKSVKEWLRVDLLKVAFVTARKIGFPELAKLGAPNDSGIHVVGPTCVSASDMGRERAVLTFDIHFCCCLHPMLLCLWEITSPRKPGLLPRKGA